MKPRIGLTMDRQTKDTYSIYPWYALRENYASILSQNGATPLPLSYEMDCMDDYLNLLDGLVVTGGNFDIPPTLYGVETVHQEVRPNDHRTAFEMALMRRALDKDIPILGICGGQQLLNVALGGTLIQYIPDAVNSNINHMQEHCRHKSAHAIEVIEGTLLSKFAPTPLIEVNSNHQQAVDRLGKDVIVNARAPDGIIEGIEVSGRKFCLGVQWHPEFQVNDLDRNLFQNFVQACK